MSIELFEHNQAAYKSAVTMLSETGKAAVIRPIGTVKSLLPEYFRTHGDLDRGSVYAGAPGIRTEKRYADGKLNKEQIAKLSEIGVEL